MKFLNKILLPIVLTAELLTASEKTNPMKLGFVNCQTSQMPKVAGEREQMAPGVVVRFTNKAGTRESFGVSNQIGVVVVPLRPGEYCYEAYNHKGQPLNLDPEQDRCFEVEEGKYVTVGVGLTADQPVPILEK
jgi:hypothetical protein